MKNTVINIFILFFIIVFSKINQSYANEKDIKHGHDEKLIYHSFQLDVETVASKYDGGLYDWELEGFVGTDTDKLGILFEGDVSSDGDSRSEDYWLFYSRKMTSLWNVKAGLVHLYEKDDGDTEHTNYLMLGCKGIAPYLVEVDSYFLLSERGDATAHIIADHELPITQKLILEPEIELNFAMQDIPEDDKGAGITSGQFELKTKYEVNKRFSPYVSISYSRKFGETSAIARKNGGDREDIESAVGISFKF